MAGADSDRGDRVRDWDGGREEGVRMFVIADVFKGNRTYCMFWCIFCLERLILFYAEAVYGNHIIKGKC